MTGIRFTHVLHKGASEILTAVLGGELQVSHATAAGSLRNHPRARCDERESRPQPA
jgi:tripartite-type tricarboxylate transporter receptor subunit TctC